MAGTDGTWYWVDASGRMGAGWLSYGGAWYWLDRETGMMAASDWIDDNGTFYWAQPSGIMASSSWVLDNDGLWHWASKSGAMAAGWLSKGSDKYYLEPTDPKHAMVTGLTTIEGQQYSFAESGTLQTMAWVAIDNSGYYSFAGATGAISSKVRKASDGSLVDENDQPLSGWITTGGIKLYANPETHAPETGWFQQEEGLYYLDPASGGMHTGWTSIDQTWYYFNAQGLLQTGWQSINGTWYYLDPTSGAMKTGWFWDGSSWFYLQSSGAMAIGWQYVNGYWYYLNSNGAMATGWIWDGGRWYFLQANGALFKMGDMLWSLNSFGFNDLNAFGSARSISSGAWADLQHAINDYSNMGCTVGFTMIDLTTGAGVAYNADWLNYSASTIKGPYVVALNKLWPWELANSESDMFITLDVSSNLTYANLCNRYGHFPLDYLVSEATAGGFSWRGDYGNYSSKDLCKMWVDIADYLLNGGQNAEWLLSICSHEHHQLLWLSTGAIAVRHRCRHALHRHRPVVR